MGGGTEVVATARVGNEDSRGLPFDRMPQTVSGRAETNSSQTGGRGGKAAGWQETGWHGGRPAGRHNERVGGAAGRQGDRVGRAAASSRLCSEMSAARWRALATPSSSVRSAKSTRQTLPLPLPLHAGSSAERNSARCSSARRPYSCTRAVEKSNQLTSASYRPMCLHQRMRAEECRRSMSSGTKGVGRCRASAQILDRQSE